MALNLLTDKRKSLIIMKNIYTENVRGFVRQPCNMAAIIDFFPMGNNFLSDAKYFHCFCNATWLPCKTSISRHLQDKSRGEEDLYLRAGLRELDSTEQLVPFCVSGQVQHSVILN